MTHRTLAVAVSALGLLVLLTSGCQWVRWNLKLKQESPDQRSDLRVYLGLQPLLLIRKGAQRLNFIASGAERSFMTVSSRLGL